MQPITDHSAVFYFSNANFNDDKTTVLKQCYVQSWAILTYSFIDINFGVIIVKVAVKQLAHTIDCFYSIYLLNLRNSVNNPGSW